MRELPRRQLERGFAAAVRERLGPLVVAQERFLQAEEALAQARRHAGAVAAWLERSARRLQQQAEALERDRAGWAVRLREAENQLRTVGRWTEGLKRLAAQLEEQECRAVLEQAEARQRELEVRGRLLEACGPLRRCRALERQQELLLEQLRQDEIRRAPLLRQVELAGTALFQLLGEALVELLGRRDGLKEEKRALQGQLDDVEQETEQVQQTLGSLAEQEKALLGRLREREQERQSLLERGDVQEREAVDDARARWTDCAADAARELERAEAEQAELQAGQARCTAERTAARERLAASAIQLERLRTDIDASSRWRERLQSDPLLCELEEVDQVVLGAAGLKGRVLAAAEAEGATLLRLQVEGAEDRRALDALRRDGLLPPSSDVERTVGRLREAGLGAWAATTYLAENLKSDPARKRELLAADPARFTGVFVASLEALAEAGALAGLERELRGPVTISPCSIDLPAAGRADGPRRVVGPEADGTFDTAAAAAEQAAIERRNARRSEAMERARIREQELRAKAAELDRFFAATGDGRFETQVEQADALEQEQEQLHALEARLQAEHEQLAGRLKALGEGRKQAEKALREAQLRLQRLDGFFRRYEQHVDSWRAALDEVRAEVEVQRGRGRKLKTEQERLRRRGQELVEELAALNSRRAELERERGAIDHRLPEEESRLPAPAVGAGPRPDEQAQRSPAGEPVPGQERPAVGGGASAEETLQGARRRWETLSALLRRELSESRLKWQLDETNEQLAAVRQELDRHLRGLTCSALELLDAEVGERLAAERELHARAVRAAANAVGQARAQLQAAKERLDALVRRREADDLPPGEPAPETSVAARERIARLCADKEQAAAARDRALEEERRCAVAGEEARLGCERREAQRQRLVDALGVLPGEPVLGWDEGWTLEQVAQGVTKALREAQDAAARLEKARGAVRDAAQAVRQVAHDPRFAEHTTSIRDRLLDEDPILVAEAPRYDVQLRERIAALDDEIGKLDRHRQTLIGSLLQVAESAERLMQDASKASRLPDTLGPWAGKPFLQIGVDFPASTEDRRARLGPLVDRMVQEGAVPGGLRLTQLAVEELHGARTFRVTILKPEAMQRTERIDVAQMVNFSGGERLTTAVLLYCALMKLRARQRGRQHQGSDGGVLVLDNPIGTCNSVPLLELQRKVSDAMGVQLIYTTGVDDLAALAQLPNVVRLRNTHRNLRTGEMHVLPDPEGAGSRGALVDGVRIAMRPEPR